jgi:hypothetical protein
MEQTVLASATCWGKGLGEPSGGIHAIDPWESQ